MPQARVRDEAYVAAVADARFLMRRAFRMIDEEARKVGLEPLDHQLLVQLRGAPGLTRTVSELATRLDVPLTLTSRLVRSLEAAGMVKKTRSQDDRRVSLIMATEAGVAAVDEVAERARRRFVELRDELDAPHRKAALLVWANNFQVEI